MTEGNKMIQINYTTSETAKLIKAELKAIFPEVKFSVRKEHYGTINIDFNGTREMKNAAEEIAAKYECGSFDGMTDSSSYADKIVGEFRIDYSTRFIFVNCHYIEQVA